MYPKLSTRRRILAALVILGGKSSYSVIKTFLPPGYGGPKFYGILKRLESDGLIRRRRPLVRLLPAGVEALERRYGQRIWRLADKNYKSYKDYNQTTWSLIILNFPTDQAYLRSRLAGRLAELGCGLLRDGAYVSAYPILDSVAQWAEENNCLERIFLFSAAATQGLEDKIWDLPGLARGYLFLLDRFGIAKGISEPRKRERAIRRIKADFLDLLVRDPLLPKPLEPADWPRIKVVYHLAKLI